MKKIILSIFAITALFSACTDLDDRLYDKIPQDQFPENAVQGALITVPVYSPMRDFIDWGGWWFCQELPGDGVVCPTRDTDWDDGGKWRVLHTHNWDNTTEAVAGMWGTFYRGIGEANKLIESLLPGAGNPEIDATMAKLRIMRAYYYYLLIDNYGDVPYVTSFSEAPELPTKTPRAETWAAIVKEVEESIAFLPDGASKTSVTKGMAFSLLAKLYINAEVYAGTPKWAEAEAATDSVIALGTYSLETNALGPFITENSTSPENIFAIPYDEDSYTGFNLHMRTLHYLSNQTFDMTVGPWNGFCALESHYNSYEDNDHRKEGFLVGQQYSSTGQELTEAAADGAKVVIDPHIPALIIDATYTKPEIRFSGARSVKFEVKMGAKDNLSNDFPIFRYADILLMKAEAMIRQGQNGDQYVNMIRTRAGLDAWTNVTLDQLLEERGREMFWEAHRRQDMIRFGVFNNAWWEKPASTPDRNVFPIPQWAVDSNPNLAK